MYIQCEHICTHASGESTLMWLIPGHHVSTYVGYKAALMRRKRRNMHVWRWYYAPSLKCC